MSGFRRDETFAPQIPGHKQDPVERRRLLNILAQRRYSMLSKVGFRIIVDDPQGLGNEKVSKNATFGPSPDHLPEYPEAMAMNTSLVLWTELDLQKIRLPNLVLFLPSRGIHTLRSSASIHLPQLIEAFRHTLAQTSKPRCIAILAPVQQSKILSSHPLFNKERY